MLEKDEEAKTKNDCHEIAHFLEQTEFIKKSLCGFYDFFLGCSLRVNLAEQFV